MRKSYLVYAMCIMLSTLTVFAGATFGYSVVNAASGSTPPPPIIYLTDQQWLAKMVKLYGPKANQFQRVKMQFDLSPAISSPPLYPTQQTTNWCGYVLD